MALTPFTGTVSATTLNSNFSDAVAQLTTNSVAGRKDQPITVFVPSLTNATALSLRCIDFTPQDDMEARIVFARGTADAAARTLTVYLTVENGDTTFLVDNTITQTVTSSGAGAFDTRTAGGGDYRTTTGVRFRALKGVTMRLTIECTSVAGTWTNAMGVLQLRTIRRAS